MGDCHAETTTAHIKGDFVVFIIGATVHNWWDVRGWLPVAQGFSGMMKELQACNPHHQLVLVLCAHARDP